MDVRVESGFTVGFLGVVLKVAALLILGSMRLCTLWWLAMEFIYYISEGFDGSFLNLQPFKQGGSPLEALLDFWVRRFGGFRADLCGSLDGCLGLFTMRLMI